LGLHEGKGESKQIIDSYRKDSGYLFEQLKEERLSIGKRE
jgi:hypothetical protein